MHYAIASFIGAAFVLVAPRVALAGGGPFGIDHTVPYDPSGPPGQTSRENLGPLSRREHRAKTVGGWRTKQPDPGLYVWRSPEGHVAVTTNQGTLVLGSSPFTHRLWRSAARTTEVALA
jgi:hypothetical protein